MPLFKIEPATREQFFQNWPSDWPSKDAFVSQHDVSREQSEAFKLLVDSKSGEREIEQFLGVNREVLALTMFLYGTGHHAAWLYPKQQLRPPSADQAGLIPDYIGAAANSNGVTWWVLELKGADKKAFRKSGNNVVLSGDANEGICQLIGYMDLSAKTQAYLRDELRLTGFREPQGVLLIGTEDESQDEAVRNFKQAWNRLNPRAQIRSYDALVRATEAKVRDIASAARGSGG
jgi:ribosomal protein S21